jgi:uncharacterized protein
MTKVRILNIALLCSTLVLLVLPSVNYLSSNFMKEHNQLNVFGSELELCCSSPMTGFYRDGHCHTGPTDYGTHTVCAIMSDEFLAFSKSKGNDLSTPRPEFSFPGLKAGDKWCLCVLRWKEALEAGMAPPILLKSTHDKSLEYVSLIDLSENAY